MARAAVPPTSPAARALRLSAALLAVTGCGDDPADSGARAAYVLVAPADTIASPGDTIRLTATALDENDRTVPRPRFAWRSSDTARARVDTAGVVVARALGDVRIEARERAGPRAFASLRLRPISGFDPAHGAFGALVTLRGERFAPDAIVRFGGAGAFVESVAADGRSLRAWVPVGGATGRISVTAGGATVETEEAFFVTGTGDDALEPNGLNEPATLAFPFHNPSLVVRPVFVSRDADVYRFQVPAEGPFRLELSDRSAIIDLIRTMRVELIDVTFQDVVGLLASYGPLTRERLRSVSLSTPLLPGGLFELLITPFSFTASFPAILAGDRSYGLRLDRAPSYRLPPDAREPNDYPRTAPALPFPADESLVIENPWAADYFSFELDAPRDVLVEISGGGGRNADDLDLFLMSMPSKSVAWIVSRGEFPNEYYPSLDFGSNEQIFASLQRGQYLVGVVDVGGVPIAYRLRIGPQAPGAPPPVVEPAPPEKLTLWGVASRPRVRP